jgi:hypothetical protein
MFLQSSCTPEASWCWAPSWRSLDSDSFWNCGGSAVCVNEAGFEERDSSEKEHAATSNGTAVCRALVAFWPRLNDGCDLDELTDGLSPNSSLGTPPISPAHGANMVRIRESRLSLNPAVVRGKRWSLFDRDMLSHCALADCVTDVAAWCIDTILM